MAHLYRNGQGDPEEVKPRNGRDFTLEELYALLDCKLIEIVDLRNGLIIVTDEEGKFKEGNTLNWVCTAIAHSRKAIWPDDQIVGSALLCRDKEVR